MEKNQKEKKVEDLIKLMDDIERAQPKPFFSARLFDRLERMEENDWVSLANFITKPITIALVLVFILLSNTLILISSEKEKISNTMTTGVSEMENLYEPTGFYNY
jgi:hypothetical protein